MKRITSRWRRVVTSVHWHLLARLAMMAGLLAFGGCQHSSKSQDQPAPLRRQSPNLLIIVADDHSGLYLGAAGDRRQATPHIDELARQGVFFKRAYCNSPLCTPSRQSFITGLLPHAVGVTQLQTKLPENVLTLGHWLSVLGYRTAAIGKMHFNSLSHHGFELRVDTEDWQAQLKSHPPADGDRRRPWRPFVDPAPIWLNARCQDAGLSSQAMESTYFVDRAISYMNQDREHPFALVVSFNEPHAPFRFPREWLGRYLPGDFPAPRFSERDHEEQPLEFRRLTVDDFQGIQAAYYTSLSFMDEQIGRLLRAMDQSGLARETVVVYLGDNGYLLGQHGRLEKHCFYEPAVRVPLIMRWPGHLPAGKTSLDMVELLDLFPTVCRLLEVPSPPVLQGTDLTPILQGTSGAKTRDVVFSEYPENEEAMARSRRYKLIVGTGRRKRLDRLHSGQPLSGPYQRLFDLDRDPDENTDLSDDPRLDAIRADLLEKMRQRLESTWTGPEPIPTGLSTLETIHWCLKPRDHSDPR
jgi:choline-sulfatase